MTHVNVVTDFGIKQKPQRSPRINWIIIILQRLIFHRFKLLRISVFRWFVQKCNKNKEVKLFILIKSQWTFIFIMFANNFSTFYIVCVCVCVCVPKTPTIRNVCIMYIAHLKIIFYCYLVIMLPCVCTVLFACFFCLFVNCLTLTVFLI